MQLMTYQNQLVRAFCLRMTWLKDKEKSNWNTDGNFLPNVQPPLCQRGPVRLMEESYYYQQIYSAPYLSGKVLACLPGKLKSLVYSDKSVVELTKCFLIGFEVHTPQERFTSDTVNEVKIPLIKRPSWGSYYYVL